MDYGPWNKLIDVFLAKNQELNLSALRTPDDVYTKHICDAMEIQHVLSLRPGSCVADVGTGGGFPLLPLAIHFPAIKFVGIDARKKKTTAIKSMVETLGLHNVQLVRSRIEEHVGTYDYITARAVAYSDTLLQRVAPLLKADGKLILYKIRNRNEKKDLIKEARKHGIKIEQEHHYILFDGDIPRVLYVLSR